MQLAVQYLRIYPSLVYSILCFCRCEITLITLRFSRLLLSKLHTCRLYFEKKPFNILALFAALVLCACTNGAKLQSGDYADAGTTAIGLGLGFSEGNPLLASAGNASPVVGLGLKLGLKSLLIKNGYSPNVANARVNSVSLGAACANIVTIAGGAPIPATIIGVSCFVTENKSKKKTTIIITN